MENRYRLHISTVGWNPPGSIVGSIRERGSDRLICDIYLDDAQVFRSGNYRVTTVCYGEEPRMYITQEKLESLQAGGDDALFEIYHELGHIELGHIELGHYAQGDSDEDAQARFAREELEADTFVCGILGREVCERMLRAELRRRVESDKLMGRTGTQDSVQAIRAIRARLEPFKA